MMSDNLLLTSLWLVPLVGAAIVLAIPNRALQAVKWVSLGITSLMFLLTLLAAGLYLSSRTGNGASESPCRFGPNTLTLMSAESRELTESWRQVRPITTWSSAARLDPYFSIQYYLGLDGISLSLVVLTGFVSVLACLASWNINKQVKGYYSLYLLLCASMIGVFISLDLFLFYVFFEVMLLPMYFLIGIWGEPQGARGESSSCCIPSSGSVFILIAIRPVLYFWRARRRCPDLAGIRFEQVELTRIAQRTSYCRVSVSGGYSSCFSSASSSNCRPSRSTRGYPMRTSRRLLSRASPGEHPAPDRRLRPGAAGMAAGPGGAYLRLGVFVAVQLSSTSSRATVAMAQTDFKSWSPIARSATWAMSPWEWP